jgi:hypothetical protein
MNREVSEGWRVQDFINELAPIFNMIQNGNAITKPFTSKAEIKVWCKDNQPYYKRHIPEVVSHFAKIARVK